MFGDLILFYGDHKTSANRLGQRLVFIDNRPIVTHTAMFSGKYSVIHSIRSGVEETLYFELMEPEASYRILRYKPFHRFLLADTANLAEFWFKIISFCGNQYNWSVGLSKRHHRHFCSELIAEIYREMGFELTKSAHRLLPTKIDRMAI